MPSATRRILVAAFAVLAVAALLVAGFVWSGAYNVGADVGHWRPVHALLEAVRERSIDARAGELQVPMDLEDPAHMAA